MKCAYEFVGGRADGQTLTVEERLTFTVGNDSYIAIVFKDDKGVKQRIFMRLGMAPADAVAKWKERHK